MSRAYSLHFILYRTFREIKLCGRSIYFPFGLHKNVLEAVLNLKFPFTGILHTETYVITSPKQDLFTVSLNVSNAPCTETLHRQPAM